MSSPLCDNVIGDCPELLQRLDDRLRASPRPVSALGMLRARDVLAGSSPFDFPDRLPDVADLLAEALAGLEP